MSAECVRYGIIEEGSQQLSTPHGPVSVEVISSGLPKRPYKDPEYPCLIDTQLKNYQEHYVDGVPLAKGVVTEPNVTLDNECPGCGMCIKWKIKEASQASPKVAEDCPVPEGQEMADVFTETADVLAIRRPYNRCQVIEGATCRLKTLVEEYKNPPLTVSASCFKCGEGVEVRTAEKLRAHRCARFGRVEIGDFVLKGTGRNGFGNLRVNIGDDIRRIKVKPTLDAKDCNLARVANHLLKDIQDGKYKFEPKTAAIASVGICHGCEYSVDCSVSANRIEPTEKTS